MFPARTVFFVVNENVTEDSILPRKGETACFRKILSWLVKAKQDSVGRLHLDLLRKYSINQMSRVSKILEPWFCERETPKQKGLTVRCSVQNERVKKVCPYNREGGCPKTVKIAGSQYLCGFPFSVLAKCLQFILILLVWFFVNGE